jgi:hypothetical protein
MMTRTKSWMDRSKNFLWLPLLKECAYQKFEASPEREDRGKPHQEQVGYSENRKLCISLYSV